MTNDHHAINTPKDYFHGLYRVITVQATTTRKGTKGHQLHLSNCEGCVRAFLPESHQTLPQQIAYLTTVVVEGYVNHECSSVLIVESIRLATWDDIDTYPALFSTPQILGENNRVRTLFDVVNSLTTDSIKRAIARTLERPDILEAFINNPASGRYHHRHKGGLLDHSVAVAKQIVSMIDMYEPDADDVYRDLGFMVGLLNDIGKVKTLAKATITQLYPHDAITLELCSSSLLYIDDRHPDCADLLRYTWTHQHLRYPNQTKVMMASYLKNADGMNAAIDNINQAYHHQDSGFASLGNNRYWRPSVAMNHGQYTASALDIEPII